MWIANNWKSYELIDSSDSYRLERWGKYVLQRPDPQVIWKDVKKAEEWKHPDGIYHRSKSGGGSWDIRNKKMEDSWVIDYGKLRFSIKVMGFKHTGIFPEQAVNWDWAMDMIKKAGRPIKVLNLFAYTGGATVACASAGASVCHVDASKGMVALAKENAALSGLSDAPIRYIVDDCAKFVEREIRRGNKYDAIILDPPSYGRGPTGEMWKLEDNIGTFLELCERVLSDNPLFMILNSYTTGLQPAAMSYLVSLKIGAMRGGRVESDEIGIPVSKTGLVLPAGATARWIND